MCLAGAFLVTGVFLGKQTAAGMHNMNIYNLASAMLLAIGQLLLPMALVQCEWFSPEGQDSSDQLRYLWMCHPRDWQWSEDQEEGDDQEQLEMKVADMDKKIETLDEK